MKLSFKILAWTLCGIAAGPVLNSARGQVVTNTITLSNASFEFPVLAQGSAATTAPGWTPSIGDPYGLYNPAAGVYAGEVNGVLPSPAQGSQVLWMNGGNYLAQFLTNTLVANQTYKLSGAIGNRGDGYGEVTTDTVYVYLLAGNTVLAQNTNLTHPTPGGFLPWAISYTSPATGFPSGPLQIRLGQNGAGEVNFDNITLTYCPAGTTTVSSSVTAVSSSQNPAPAGSVVTFTATVSGSGGPPSGTVAFFDGSNSLGSNSLNGLGVATFATAALSVGGSPHSITAAYSGNSAFGASGSSVLSQVVTNAGTNPSTNAPGGLVARWPFAEGSGMTTADSSGNGNTGTLIASPQWVAGFAGSNYALEFPGAAYPGAAYVSAPGSATLADQGLGSNLTICAWVKRSPASVGKYCSVVAKDVLADSAPYHRNYELIFDTGSHLNFVYRNNTGTAWEEYASSAVYTDSTNWHFYCVTYTYGSAFSCVLYVDGSAVAGSWVSGNGSDAPASTSGGPVLLGMDGTGTSCNGSLYDQISIYGVALTSSQIGALYTGGSAAGMAGATTLASSQNPALAGGAVTFTATVSGSGGVPTGTVAFYDGSNNLGAGSLNSSGVAALSDSALSVSGSPHAITAVYSGNSAYASSTSSVLSQIITNAPLAASATTVTSPQNPAPAGGAVTFTATVSGSVGVPTGTVAFYDGSNNLGAGTLNSAGVAALSDSALSVSGSPHVITAVYSGNSAYTGSTSSVLTQVITNIVTVAASATTVTSSQNPALAGGAVTFTATVSGSGGIPTGTVTFLDGGNNLGSSALNNSGAATFSAAALSAAGSPHSITAVYSGNSSFAGSVSSVLMQFITSSSATTITSSQNPAPASNEVTFTAVVTGTGGTPTGTVAFFDGTNNLGGGSLNSSGVQTFSTASLSASGSPHAITAVYSGSSAFASSASGVLSQVVTNSFVVVSGAWELTQRLDYPAIPIAVFRPTIANSVMVVDEMPNGIPSDNGNGIVWHDLCLEDSFTNDTIIIHTLHAAAHTNFLEISSQAYNGGNPLPLLFGQGSGNVASTVFAAGISNNVFYAYNGLGGVADGSSASAGRVGEYVSSAVPVGSAVGLASGAAANVTSISLTPGDWDVAGVVSFNIVSGSVSSSTAGIATVSSTLPSDGTAVACALQSAAATTYNSIPIARKQMSVASTTVVYLVGTCNFSAGNVSAFGQITARRMR
jgi:hypothetical protein